MLDWDDLRYFLSIARHGTLSAAARALGVQQSTMGRRLDAIETRAGARLLQKTPSGFVLTIAGEAIINRVERIETEALAVERAIAGKDVRFEGRVRLTAVESIAVNVLTPILAEFHEKYPEIALDIVTGSRKLSLTRREADVALRFSEFTQQDLVARKVADVAVGVYASREYLARHGMPDFTLGAIGHKIVVRSEELMATPDMEWFSELTCTATIVMRSNSIYELIAAAQAGMGMTCIVRYLGDTSGLVRLKTPPTPVMALWMGIHNDIRQMPRIHVFTDFIAAGLRQRAQMLNPLPSSPA